MGCGLSAIGKIYKTYIVGFGYFTGFVDNKKCTKTAKPAFENCQQKCKVYTICAVVKARMS